ncbi:cation transporter [Sphingobium fluviale]|uniref:Cation transporter n=1 Tax=Sphingobium fluviale TaxID=2506423 RepID=A0A4Q1KM59_9SPHN|nr:cation transporter [Sphingobium fluviale]RXR30792.1 cation transporter [Sphingobium fluviale]
MADECCASACGGAVATDDVNWRRVLWIALVFNVAMFVVEAAAGHASGSRSLQADALDFLGDSANYAISLGVAGLASAWRSRTALAKGVTILAFACAVAISAIWGLLRGTHPDPWTMSGVGALALAVNAIVAIMLFRYRVGDANMRSVWICSRNDAINNLLVIGAGIAVLWMGSGLPDLIVAMIMAALGIQGGWHVVRQAFAELQREKAAA